MKKQNQYQTAEEWMGSQGRVVSTTNNRTGIQTAEEWMQANATAEKEKSAQIKSKANQLYTQFQNGPTGNTKKKPQVFSAGSSDLINRLVNDYKAQKAAYQDRLALEEERNTLEQQAKWLAEGSPEKKDALADIEKLNKKLAGSQAQKPRVPLLDQKDYSNSRSNAGKEDSATKALRAQAARLQQQMEQEQALWDAAQANAMGIGTQALAEAKRRYDQKYSEYSAHYNAIAKQLPGAWTEAELQQQRNTEKIRQLESQLPSLYNVLYRRYPNGTPEQSPEYQKALAQVNRVRNQIAALKKEGAGLAATIDSERQERMGAPEEGERVTTVDAIGYDDPEKAELEIGTEEAMTNQQERFMEYLDLAANVESMGAPLEDVEAARDRRDNALGTIRESQQERAQAVRDRNEARLQERERGVSAYETDRYRDDFQKVSQNARRENPDKDTDPVGHYFANKGAEDLQEAVGGGTINRYNFLSDGEIDEYYYLLGSRGTDAAMDYLDALEVTLDKRIADFRSTNTEIAYGTSGGVGKTVMNAMSVPANVVGSITAGAADLINTVRGKYNPYSPGHELTDYAGTLRNVTARDIMGGIENPFWGAVAANTYQAVMSGADSALGATLFGNGYTWIMGSGAASQRAKELYEKGASPAQIGLGAIGSGLIEVATENYSIEYFTENFLKGNVTGFRDWMKKTLIQSLNEGSEEVASDLANLVVDAMLEGANSDYRDGIQALVAQGMSREEAEKKAFLNQAIDTFWSFYGGAVSGGMMGGVGGIVNATTSEARKTGKTLVDSGSYEEILRNALELNPENKDAAKLADKAKKGTLGKRGSDYAKLTNIYQGILSELTQRDVSTVKDAVKAQAEALGVGKNSDLVASGVVKKLTGEKPSMSERYAMAQNQKITDSLLGDIRKAGTGEEESAEWVRKIDTYAISHEGFGVRDTETAKSARAAVHDQLSQAAESIFGKEHAFAVEQLYNPMQSRGRYVEEMAKVYKAGQEGIEISQIQGVGALTGAQVTLAYNLGKQSVDGSSFDYDGEANGQSYLISDNSPVNIQGIASAGGGGLVLLTDEGERVKAQDVKFGSYGTARLFKAIATMGVDAQTGNAILEASRNSRLSDSNFAVAVLDAYNGGRNGIALNAMGRDSNAMRLDEATRKIAWEAGRDSSRAQTRQKQQTIDRGKHPAKKGSLTVESSAKSIDNLTQQQKSGMDAARLLSEMGLDITVYASTEEQRKAGMENGSIRLEDGSIRVDLNAGADGQGVMAFAMSHEFTHFVEEFSPEKFRKFTEALFEAMGAEVDVNELIAAKAAALRQQGYKGLGDNELNDLAYSEVVAEMMETALTDTDVMERISARLQQTDKSLWGRIRKFLQGLVDRLKEAYRGLNPDSSIAQLARDTIRSSQEALNAFADAAEDAVVNYRLQDGEKNNAPEDVRFSQRYLAAEENQELVALVERVRSGNFRANDKVYLGIVSGKNAAQIQKITGVNVAGFRIAIEARQIEHILKRHGDEGISDHSMAQTSDISKMQYTLENPDSIIPAGKSSAYVYMENGKNRTSDTVLYEKSIGEKSYYVVQAVANTKARTLHIVTAFIGESGYRKGTPQFTNAKNLGATSETAAVDVPRTTIAQPDADVKGVLKSSRDTSEMTYAEILAEQAALRTRQEQVKAKKNEAMNNPELLRAMDSYTEMFSELRNLLGKKHRGEASVADIERISEIKSHQEETLKKVTEIQDELGLNGITEEEAELRSMEATLRKAADSAWAREGTQKENKAIEKSGLSAPEYFRRKALRAFKTTRNFNEAGYLLPDGKMLDFSGSERNHRYRDHREIGEIYEATQGANALNRFLNDGNIRIMAESPGVDISANVEPTAEQYAAIRKFVMSHGTDKGEFFVDFSNSDGRNVGNYSYNRNVSPERVLNDIKYFYENGETRKQSEIAEFLYSSRTAMDSSGNALTGAQQKYFENSQVRDARGNLMPVYHTTYDDFFTFDRARLGENTLGNGTDAWLAATALVGHWFNTQDLSRQMGGKATDFYLNVENPYSVSSLNELASEIMAFSDDPDTAQAEYEDGNYFAIQAAAAAYVNSLRENGYDGIITPDAEFGGKSYVVLDSAQAKLTTNKNPTENPDIRFSQRISAEERVERMETEIQYLKKLVQIQRMGNKDYTLDRNSLKQLAAQLIREHNAKGNSTELAALLEDTYNYISRDKDMTWAGIEERAGKAADWLEEHRKEQRDEYAQEILDWMAKRHVRLSEGQIGEIKYSYGSVRDFQRAIRGSIVVDQKSNTSLDQFWQEAAAQFADQFDSEIPDTDMPGALAELVQRLQDSRSAADMEAEYYREQSRYDLVEKIYEMYWSAKPVESISDKLKGEIAQLKKERNAALEKAARAKTQQERVKQALADYRNQRDAEAKAMKKAYEAERRQIEQAYQQEMKTAAKEVREKAAKTEERFKLERVLSDLNRRLLSPTKTLYVPDSLQPAVTMAMQSIATIKQQEAQETARRVIARYGVQLEGLMKDPVKNAQAIAETEAKLQNVLERQRATVQNALERMQQAYSDLAEVNKGVFTQDYNEGILELIDDAKKAIGSSFYGELSIEQLQAVRRAYTAILNTIRNANKLHGENLKQGWAETAQQAMAEFREQPDKKPALGRLKQTTEKLSWNNEKPYYAFERMGSSVMMQLYENLRNGEDGWYRDFAEGRAYMLACMDKYHFDQWEDSLVEVEMADGERVELDLQERMSLYAASKREQYQKHLTGEGFILTGSKRRGKDYKDYTSHVLALETVIQIRNGQVLGLTAEQIAYADEMQEYLSTVCAEQNNQVSRALYGVSKAKEKDYWPIKSSSIRSERVRNSQEFSGNRQKNAGHMKNTVKNASNAVELSGFMVTWANHVNDTAMYHNITLPMEDFFRVYNYKTDGDSIRQQMLRKHGEASVAYVDTLLKDVNGGVRADGREAVYNLFLSGFKKAAVSASLSVAIQQPSAVGRAFSVINAKYFVGSKVDSAGGISATWEEMKKFAPVVGLKEIGRFDTDMGRSTQELLSGKNEKGFMAAVDKISGWMPEQMDKITWIAMWEAAKRQTKSEHPGLSGEALKTEAGKLFTKCITQTQVYDSVFSRSGNMRSKSLYMKMLTSFMAEPTTTINMMESAIRDIRRKNFKAGNKKIASVAAALILNSLLASLVYAARDDDEEKTYLEKYLSSLSSELVDGVNPITYYPGFKDVWSIVQGYDVERNDMSLVSSMYKAVRKATSSWKKYLETDEDDQEARKESLEKFGVDSLDAAAGLLNLGGIPAKNILRELRGAKNTYDTVSTPRASDSYTRGKAIWEGIQENIPAIFRGSNGKTERLYSAIVSGSQAELERLRATYSTEKKYENAIVTALADQDSRIRQAAKAKAAGNAKEAERILAEIEAEGHFSRKQIQSAFEKKLKKVPGGSKESVKEQYLDGEIDRSAAIKQLTGVLGMKRKDAEAQVTQWNSVRDTGIEFDEIQKSYLNNSLTESRAAQLLVRYGGKSEEAAKKTVKEWGCKKDLDVNYSDLKDAFLTGEITEQQLKNALIRYGGKDTAEAEETVWVLRWQKKHPDSELSNEQVLAYTRELDNFGKSIEAAGIGTELFADYRERRAKCTGVDADGDGRTDSGSKKEEILALIDSLPLTSGQKDALYFDNGYAASGLRKAPWNRR